MSERFVTQGELDNVVNNINSNLVGTTDNLQSNQNFLQEQIKSISERENNNSSLFVLNEILKVLQHIDGDLHEMKHTVNHIDGDLHEMKDTVKHMDGDLHEMKDTVKHMDGDLHKVVDINTQILAK